PFAARLELGRAPGGPLAQLERAQLLLDQRLVVGPVLGERLEPGQLGPRPVDAIVALAGVDQALIEQRELVLAGDPLLAGAGLLAEDPLALGQRRGQLTVELAGAVELGREPASALAGAAAGLLELGQPGPQLAELDLDVRQVAAQELELGAALGQLGVAALASGDAIARSEEHTSELQSRENLVCRLLLEKKKSDMAHELLAAALHRRHDGETSRLVATALRHLLLGVATLAPQRQKDESLSDVTPAAPADS